MTLIKWNPTYRPTLFNEIDRWFDNITSDFPAMLENRTLFKLNNKISNTEPLLYLEGRGDINFNNSS